MSWRNTVIYISNIPKIPEYGINFTAEQLYDHAKKQATSYEIENFTRSHFDKKIRELSEIQEQSDLLRSKAKEITRLAQRIFDLKVPRK